MAVDRSLRPEVRNPVLGLPAISRIKELPPDVRQAIAALIDDIGKEARVRAQKSWKQNKGPMAAYWKVVGAYSTHIKRAIRP